MANLLELFQEMIDTEASDLHLTVGTPPQFRIHGTLKPAQMPALTKDDTEKLCFSILSSEEKEHFKTAKELDFSFGFNQDARFRVNLYYQQGAVAGAFRRIAFQPPSFDSLGLPKIIKDLVSKPNGLFLVTGPTGSGKTTTLASIIDRINSEKEGHILTIEDPIEYLHPHKKSIVNQREVGTDTKNFKEALRYVLRQDPDVVLIGEMRDLETIEAALTLAETGHLCLATLHTNGTVQTINRIVDVFPANQQERVKTILSFILTGVVSQQLIPHADGQSRVLATEVLVPTTAVRNLIREGKLHQIYANMQMGQGHIGSRTFNQSLYHLVECHKISPRVAVEKSNEVSELKQMLRKGGYKVPEIDYVKP